MKGLLDDEDRPPPPGGLSFVEKSAIMYGLRRVLQMKILDGYKVKLGASAAMLTGAGSMLLAVVQMINSGEIHLDALKAGWEMFLGGWLAWGFGHKMEKAVANGSPPAATPPPPGSTPPA